MHLFKKKMSSTIYFTVHCDIFCSIINPVKIQLYLMHVYLSQFLTEPLYLYGETNYYHATLIISYTYSAECN